MSADVTTRRGLAAGLALTAMLAGAGAARADDDWFGRDKALHFGASATLAAGGYGVSSIWLDEEWERATAGLTVSLAAGAAKEIWDAAGHGDPSWKDATWDLAGAAVGVAIALLADHLIADR